MSRASGRKNPAREPVPGTPEADEIGLTGRQGAKGTSPIPAGSTGGPHIVNRQSFRQPVPVGEQLPEHGGIMAHGVPPEAHTAHERGDAMRGPNEVKQPVPAYRKTPDGPLPVPVYLVERAAAKPINTLASDKFTVPAAGSDPIRIAGRDKTRHKILLMVETAAGAGGAAPQGIRIDHEVGNLTFGGGALVRAGAVSYLKLECNDELFAVSTDSGVCVLSVIFLYGVPGGG